MPLVLSSCTLPTPEPHFRLLAVESAPVSYFWNVVDLHIWTTQWTIVLFRCHCHEALHNCWNHAVLRRIFDFRLMGMGYIEDRTPHIRTCNVVMKHSFSKVYHTCWKFAIMRASLRHFGLSPGGALALCAVLRAAQHNYKKSRLQTLLHDIILWADKCKNLAQ